MKNQTDIEQQIKQSLKTASKIITESWKIRALENPDCFDALVRIGLTNEKPFCWRCTWVIFKATELKPELINPYISQIINSLNNFKHDSQIGGFLKTLTYAKEIEEEHLGILTDYCIKIIYDTQRPSHNKYYSMQLLIRIAKIYPDLSREFSLIIEENMPYFEKPYLKKFGRNAIFQLS